MIMTMIIGDQGIGNDLCDVHGVNRFADSVVGMPEKIARRVQQESLMNACFDSVLTT